MDPEFDAAIAPLREALAGLIRGPQSVREHAGFLPAADSEAMREVAEEPRFAAAWGRHQVSAAHSFSLMLVTVAENTLAAVVALLSAEQDAYVTAPAVLTRSAIEQLGRAAYVAERGIEVEHRVVRWANERLANMREVDRLKGDKGTADRRDELVESARSIGIAVHPAKKGRPLYLGDHERPGGTAVVRRLFADPDSTGLGALFYGYFSAVTHGTLYGILENVSRAESDSSAAVQTGSLRQSARSVNQVLMAGIYAYTTAVDTVHGLMGWSDDDGARSRANALRLVHEVNRAQHGSHAP